MADQHAGAYSMISLVNVSMQIWFLRKHYSNVKSCESSINCSPRGVSGDLCLFTTVILLVLAGMFFYN